MYRALVSGVTGHLGRELAAQLAAAGVEVHGLIRQDTAFAQSRNDVVRLHQIDGSTERLVAIVREVRPDVVFHLAAVARREHHMADITPFITANVLFGAQLLESMRHSDCMRLVIAGSYLQHFNTDGYRAFNLYAATKQALEDIVAFYVDAFRLSAVRLTLPDIYSEHDTRSKLMTHVATAWATRTPLQLQSDEAWIDPLHVEDAAAACLRAAHLLETDLVARGSLIRYSVTSGQDVSATQLVRLFETHGDRQIPIRRGIAWAGNRKIMPWRGETLPGWSARVALQEGIARIVAQRCR